MKIDVTQKKFNKLSKRKLLNKQNMNKNCYTCDKLKYFSRKCIQNKYKSKSSLYDNQNRIIATIKVKFTNNHRCLS